MKLVGSAEQAVRHFKFDASGTIATGGTPQLLLPERKSTSFLVITNISDTIMYIEFGSARATAALSGTAVNSVTVTNGGFGFTKPPAVWFYGGGINIDFNNSPNPSFVGAGLYGYPPPSGAQPTGPANRPAQAHATLSAGVVNAIVVDDGGQGYVVAPQVFLTNSLLDPNGVASPFFSSTLSGIPLNPGGGSYYVNGTTCTTDPISIYCATTGKAFTCKWMS